MGGSDHFYLSGCSSDRKMSSQQGVISQGVETIIRALWFICDAEQDWNQLAFPLSIRCQGKKNGAVELEVGSDLLLYILRSLQSIIRFDIWRISMRYTEDIQVFWPFMFMQCQNGPSTYRILQVEGRVFSFQSKPNDNKRLQKNM